MTVRITLPPARLLLKSPSGTVYVMPPGELSVALISATVPLSVTVDEGLPVIRETGTPPVTPGVTAKEPCPVGTDSVTTM